MLVVAGPGEKELKWLIHPLLQDPGSGIDPEIQRADSYWLGENAWGSTEYGLGGILNIKVILGEYWIWTGGNMEYQSNFGGILDTTVTLLWR